MNTSTLVQKLWNYYNGPRVRRSLARSPACEHAGAREKSRLTRRDDGMSYGDYVEQLTYLLFLKIADERSRPPHHQPSPIPAAYAWPALLARDGDALFDHYRHTLEELGRQPGTLERNAQDTKSGAGQYFTPRALVQMAVGATTVLFGMWGRRVPAPDMMGA